MPEIPVRSRMPISSLREPRFGTGWRVAIVLAGTVAIWSLMTGVSLALADSDDTVRRIVCAVIVCGLAVPMVIVARRFLDRRPWSELRLQGWPRAWRPLLVGVASFLIPSAVGVGVATTTGWVRISSDATPLILIASVAFTVVTVLLLEAIPEELIFRGYIYGNLSTAMASIVAVVVQALMFAALGTALWVATTGWSVLVERGALFLVMGLLLGILRVVSGSVWNPIGFHLGFQVVAQTLLMNPHVEVSDDALVTVAGIAPGFVFGIAVTASLGRWLPLREEVGAPQRV